MEKLAAEKYEKL